MTAYASSTARTAFVGIPNQSVVAPALALEVERRQRAFRADPLEHPLGHLGVLGEDPRRAPAQVPAEPRELAHRDERESLVVRLEDLAAFVEHVAPVRVVAGDACVQHEIVAPTGNGERVELDRAEPAEDLEHRIGASLDRPRGREELPRDEKAARGLGGRLHPEDASEPLGGLLQLGKVRRKLGWLQIRLTCVSTG